MKSLSVGVIDLVMLEIVVGWRLILFTQFLTQFVNEQIVSRERMNSYEFIIFFPLLMTYQITSSGKNYTNNCGSRILPHD